MRQWYNDERTNQRKNYERANELENDLGREGDNFTYNNQWWRTQCIANKIHVQKPMPIAWQTKQHTKEQTEKKKLSRTNKWIRE